jgi:hypothetical protein
MSRIAIVGSGPEEEASLVTSGFSFSELSYDDLLRGVDLSRFKLLLFPPRIGVYDKKTYLTLQGNVDVQGSVARYIRQGGCALVFPPFQLDSDWSIGARKSKSISINWLPFRCQLRKVAYRTANFRVVRPDRLGSTAGLGVRSRLYVRFDSDRTASYAWLQDERGNSVSYSHVIGKGEVLLFSPSLAERWQDAESRSGELGRSDYFRAVIEWALARPSIANSWNLVLSSPQFSSLLPATRSIDAAISDGDLAAAEIRAWQALESMLRIKRGLPTGSRVSAKRLLEGVFKAPDGDRDGEWRWYLAHMIRVLRNETTHGSKAVGAHLSSDEVDVFLCGCRSLAMELSREGPSLQ